MQLSHRGRQWSGQEWIDAALSFSRGTCWTGQRIGSTLEVAQVVIRRIFQIRAGDH
jgi:hypothetical protein